MSDFDNLHTKPFLYNLSFCIGLGVSELGLVKVLTLLIQHNFWLHQPTQNNLNALKEP